MINEEFSLPGIPEEYEITVTSSFDAGLPNYVSYFKKVRHIPSNLLVSYIVDPTSPKFSKENEKIQLMQLKKAVINYYYATI